MVRAAIAEGYCHLDSAADYGNEAEVGEGIRLALQQGLVDRDSLWVTSKLWNTYHRPEHVRSACERTLKDLGLSELDLYLIHFPIALEYVDFETRYPPAGSASRSRHTRGQSENESDTNPAHSAPSLSVCVHRRIERALVGGTCSKAWKSPIGNHDRPTLVVAPNGSLRRPLLHYRNRRHCRGDNSPLRSRPGPFQACPRAQFSTSPNRPRALLLCPPVSSLPHASPFKRHCYQTR